MNAPERIIDLRGFSAPAGLKFVEEDEPQRLSSASPKSPWWIAAEFEIRTVETTSVDGINPGDRVLFSRCEPDRNFADD